MQDQSFVYNENQVRAVSAWIARQSVSRISSTERIVLWALSTYANERGQAYPAKAKIAARSGCSEKTVQRTIKSLSEKGLVERRFNFRSSNTVILSDEVLGLEAEASYFGSDCPVITDTSIDSNVNVKHSKNRVDGNELVITGQNDQPCLGSDDTLPFKVSRRESVADGPDLGIESKEILQPHVDTLLAKLVEHGLKDAKYVSQDRRDNIWYYVSFWVISDELGQRDRWLPDDPRWQYVFDDAFAKLTEEGVRRVRPDRSFLRDAIIESRSVVARRLAEEVAESVR